MGKFSIVFHQVSLNFLLSHCRYEEHIAKFGPDSLAPRNSSEDDNQTNINIKRTAGTNPNREISEEVAYS